MSKIKYKNDSVLVVGDTHFPFVKKGYLDFCLDIKRRVKCEQVVHIGDLCDNHAISYHEHDPNGRSPIDEMVEADKHLKQWFRAFPSLFLCKANHDLVDRKARTEGLPDRLFRPFRDIWGLPKGWQNEFNFNIDGVIYQHGTGYSGDNAHLKAAYNNRASSVIGHTHANAGVGYIANEKDCIFGMNVGCGIDRNTYAMNYGRDFKKKPIISCGVVTDHGQYCQIFTMPI